MIPDPTLSDDVRWQAAGGMLRSTLSALEALERSWDRAAVDGWTSHVLAREGRVVLSGMGKSGLIARKISATLASTGCPSLFIHPADALHGDLGMVTSRDTALLLSNSGETQEILQLLPSLVRIGVKVAAITSNAGSRLAQAADWQFIYALPEGEGCPLNIAPMASTTLQLTWGDLLSAHLMSRRGFTLEAFARLHPAGTLGSKLLKVKNLMHTDIPVVRPETPLVPALAAMSKGRLGMAVVMEGGNLRGVVSDGDIRRSLEKAQAHDLNPMDLKAGDIMTSHPVSIRAEAKALEGAALLEERKITFLLVLDEAGQLAGVLHIHDLLGAKVL